MATSKAASEFAKRYWRDDPGGILSADLAARIDEEIIGNLVDAIYAEQFNLELLREIAKDFRTSEGT